MFGNSTVFHALSISIYKHDKIEQIKIGRTCASGLLNLLTGKFENLSLDIAQKYNCEHQNS